MPSLASGKNKFVLSMIVKNEADVLARCLQSVRPLLSAWVVVDTGSTDRTREIAREVLADIPGEVVDRPWKNFGHNRTEALELSRGRGDYSLVIDADDTLEMAPDLELPPLTLDSYALRVRYGTISYDRVQFLRNAKKWRYEGVLHEFPACDGSTTQGKVDSITYVIGHQGARAKDPRRFERDAAILEAALSEEPDNRRHAFYLAQSYRDAKMPAKALDAYERRATMGGWDEEVFNSHLEAARARECVGQPFEVVQEAYLRAYEFRPRRAESLYELARYCRLRERYALGCLYASAACRIQRPNDALFVVDAVYAWRAKDEHAVSAYHCGDYALALTLNQELLANKAVPEADRRRVLDNLGWCLRGLEKRQ